mmetsp:Transcript_18681/g.30696  ORF Transcript_18681/g.30696 Transcript_18681/m.30696 type:complete len:341 (+) Transcript_18681:1074-2096(+)
MFLAIVGEIRLSYRPYGLRARSACVGNSVPSASAPIVSMIMLTQRSWMGFRGRPMPATADTNATTSATTLTVSWNWTNLRMLSYTHRPHITALTMEEKLSSIRTISDASLATSVPEMFIASPTSASFKAGASFVPSPVTATTSPRTRSLLTSVCLSVGEARARTCSRGSRASSCWSVSFRNSAPSMATPSVYIPHSEPIRLAVFILSPVTILTKIPARLHSATAAGTSLRRGSVMPTNPIRMRSSSGGLASHLYLSSTFKLRYANNKVLSPDEAIVSIRDITSLLLESTRGSISPFAREIWLQRPNTTSDAPFVYMRNLLPPRSIMVLILFRADEKTYSL